MIAIKSNKPLKFNPVLTGEIVMEIDIIQNKPRLGVYEMRIVESCYKNVEEKYFVYNETEQVFEEKTRTVRKQVGESKTRFSPFTYDEIDDLSISLDVDMSDKTKLRENYNEMFRQGLLLVTQQECLKGEAKYDSSAEDWEIVRDNG